VIAVAGFSNKPLTLGFGTRNAVTGNRNWWIFALILLVLALLGGLGVLVARADAAAWLVDVVTRLEGVQWLLTRLDTGSATSSQAVEELLEEATALKEAGKHNEALRTYDRVLELAPDEVRAYLGKADSYESLGKWDEALDTLQKAADLAPDNAEVQRQLGRLHCLQNHRDECIATLERAVEMEPDNEMGRYWLALAYQQTADQGYERALQEYLEVLRLNPELARAHLALGNLYLSRPGNEALALEAYTRALRLATEQDDPALAQQVRAALARLYYAEDNYTQCIEQWQEVLSESPNDPDAHRRLGLCYGMRGREGDLEQAIVELERALQLEFLNLDAYYFYLGQYHAQQGDYARAAFSWEQFLRFSQDEERNALVRQLLRQLEQAQQESAP